MDSKIQSKTLWFKVENDADRKVIDNIVRTGRIPLTCCEMLIYVRDNVLLYNQENEMSLEQGMDTLKQTFKLTSTPVRIEPDSALLDCFFESYMVKGYGKYVKLAGDITRRKLRTLVVQSRNRIKNNKILTKGAAQCLLDGDITMGELRCALLAERMWKQQEIMRSVSSTSTLKRKRESVDE